MRREIAVSTVSGKAYYLLVKELKNRNVFFSSFVPGKTIPPSFQVVITTENERHLIDHPNILVYDPAFSPLEVIDKALRLIQNKESFKEVVVGIDPGKSIGIAVLGDGEVLKKECQLSIEMALNLVFTEIQRNPAQEKRVRIGDGIPSLFKELADRLDIGLPKDTVIEKVSEIGTSSDRAIYSGTKKNDADSAVEIAYKNGILYHRS